MPVDFTAPLLCPWPSPCSCDGRSQPKRHFCLWPCAGGRIYRLLVREALCVPVSEMRLWMQVTPEASCLWGVGLWLGMSFLHGSAQPKAASRGCSRHPKAEVWLSRVRLPTLHTLICVKPLLTHSRCCRITELGERKSPSNQSDCSREKTRTCHFLSVKKPCWRCLIHHSHIISPDLALLPWTFEENSFFCSKNWKDIFF